MSIMSSTASIQLGPNRFHLRIQWREMDRDYFPNTVEVNSQVVMDQHISETDDGSPVDVSVTSLQIIADPLSGFGEDLEVDPPK